VSGALLARFTLLGEQHAALGDAAFNTIVLDERWDGRRCPDAFAGPPRAQLLDQRA